MKVLARPELPRLGPWLLVAIAGGVVWALCFGRHETLLAPWIALVPLLLVLDRTPPAAAGFVHGAAYWLVATIWIQPTLTEYGGLPTWLAALGLLALSCYLALYSAVFAGLGARLWRRGGWMALLGLPALWVVLETIRGWALTGFPWNLAAYSLTGVPGALPLSAWIGAWGLSFLVVAVNVAVALLVSRRKGPPAVATIIVTAGLLAFGFTSAPPPAVVETDERLLDVRVLQPNSEILSEWDEGVARASYRRLLRQTEQACAAGPALIIWPESAAWPFSYQRHAALRRDVQRIAANGCPVLFNSAIEEDGEFYNAALLVSQGADDQRYDKQHLVPFGEYVPLARWLPFLGTVARAAGGFSAGRGASLLELSGERLGVSICFEIVFPAEVARRVRHGATLLITITNDGWYGDSSAPWQHYRAARFRAAENRRTLLRAAITGVSGVIDPGGRVLSELGVGERGTLSAAVRGSRERTLFGRFPWLVPALCWGLAGFAIFRGSSR